MTTHTLSADRRAVISIELAVVASLLLVPLTMGATDAAELIVARGQLDQVLHQALFYAYANNGKVAASDVQTYAAQAFGTGTAPTIVATITPYCILPISGFPVTGTPDLAVNNVCAVAGLVPQSYLSVTASVTVTLPFAVPWVAQTSTLSVSGKARIL